ncbi:hypothetical protein HDU80_007262, partial [Chytriomyces hyalinus]
MDSSAQLDAASKINIFLKGVSREHKKEVFQEIITSTGRDDDWTKFQNFILLINERSRHTAACGNDSDNSASTVDSSESKSEPESSSESDSSSESSGSRSDSEGLHKQQRHAKKSKKGKEVKKHKSTKKTKHHSSGVVAPIPASTSTPPKPLVDEELAKVMEGLKIFTAEVMNILKNNTSARPVSKKNKFRCLWDDKICGTTEHLTSKPSECPQFQQDVRNGWKVKVMKSRDSLKEFYHLDDAEGTFMKPLIGDGGCRKRILNTFKQQAGVTASLNVISVEVKHTAIAKALEDMYQQQHDVVMNLATQAAISAAHQATGTPPDQTTANSGANNQETDDPENMEMDTPPVLNLEVEKLKLEQARHKVESNKRLFDKEARTHSLIRA